MVGDLHAHSRWLAVVAEDWGSETCTLTVEAGPVVPKDWGSGTSIGWAVVAEDWGSKTCTHAVCGWACGAELAVTLEILRSSLDSKSDVGAREYGSSKRFRKKYYSMANNGVDGQRERSMAATEVAAGLLVLRCECWFQAGWLSVHLARS